MLRFDGGRVLIVCDWVNPRSSHLISASSVSTRSVLRLSRRHVAQLAFLFGLITFVANYIPNVGAIVATLLPLPFVLLDPSVSTAVRYALCRHVAPVLLAATTLPLSTPQAPRLHPPPLGAHARGQRHRAQGVRISDGAAPDRRAALARLLGVALGYARVIYTCNSRESSLPSRIPIAPPIASSSHLHLTRRLRRDPLRPSHRRASHCAERLARSAQHGASRDVARRRTEPDPRRPPARSITGGRRCEAQRNRKRRRLIIPGFRMAASTFACLFIYR